MAKLQNGEKFPDFSFHTASGKDLTSGETVKKAKKTVFWFLRYVGCTTCRYDIHLIKTRYKEFTDRGYQVLVVLQSTPESVNLDLKDDPSPYEIITDPDQTIYKNFEIEAPEDKEARRPKEAADVAKWEAKIAKVKASGFVHGRYEGNENQLPALFIVAPDSTILLAHYAKNSIDMPTVDELLGQLG